MTMTSLAGLADAKWPPAGIYDAVSSPSAEQRSLPTWTGAFYELSSRDTWGGRGLNLRPEDYEVGPLRIPSPKGLACASSLAPGTGCIRVRPERRRSITTVKWYGVTWKWLRVRFSPSVAWYGWPRSSVAVASTVPAGSSDIRSPNSPCQVPRRRR